MNFSPTGHRTSAGAFTLVEMMVAASAFTVVGVAVLGVLISTMQLSSENVVANLSNFRARQALDRMGEIIRYSQSTPVLINADGTAPTSTTVVNTVMCLAADGVLIKNALGGPYVFKNSNGLATADIPNGTNQFMVEYSPAVVAAPAKGDYFLLNLSTHPELEVSGVAPATPSGSLSRVVVTTQNALAETVKQPLSPALPYTVSAVRYRKEAYVFAQNGTQWDLRRYQSVIASTVYTNAANYVTMGTGFQKLTNQAVNPPVSLPWFTAVPDSGTQTIWLRALARSSDHGEYNEYFTGRNTLTAMPVQGKLWNYNPPPPAN